MSARQEEEAQSRPAAFRLLETARFDKPSVERLHNKATKSIDAIASFDLAGKRADGFRRGFRQYRVSSAPLGAFTAAAPGAGYRDEAGRANLVTGRSPALHRIGALPISPGQPRRPFPLGVTHDLSLACTVGAFPPSGPYSGGNGALAMAKAVFAAGCFWGVQDAFDELDGVTKTTVGYIGGVSRHPTYEQVCGGRTHHAEAVEVEYDPARLSYRALLDHFFGLHDPTTLNRQGPDIGTQYRSAIFPQDDAQKLESEATIAALNAEPRSGRRVVTTIEPKAPFWPAEDYHQHYFQKRGIKGGCHF